MCLLYWNENRSNQILILSKQLFSIATLGRTWEFSSAEILASNELASSTTRVVLFPERTGRPAGRPPDRISWDREELTDWNTFPHLCSACNVLIRIQALWLSHQAEVSRQEKQYWSGPSRKYGDANMSSKSFLGTQSYPSSTHNIFYVLARAPCAYPKTESQVNTLFPFDVVKARRSNARTLKFLVQA